MFPPIALSYLFSPSTGKSLTFITINTVKKIMLSCRVLVVHNVFSKTRTDTYEHSVSKIITIVMIKCSNLKSRVRS